MSDTPAHALHDLKHRSLQLLTHFASTTRDMTQHRWLNTERRTKAMELSSMIKRDISELKVRLDKIGTKHARLNKGVEADPHGPAVLAAGGDYMQFIDDVIATVGPVVADLAELVTDEIDDMDKAQEEAVQ